MRYDATNRNVNTAVATSWNGNSGIPLLELVDEVLLEVEEVVVGVAVDVMAVVVELVELNVVVLV
jgi:hypothetical protein